MTTSKTWDEERTRERAAAVAHHRQVVELLLGDAVRSVVAGLRLSGGTALDTLPLLTPEQADFFYQELAGQEAWQLERWLILPDESVRICDETEFAATPPEQHFSFNDCLRKIPADAYRIRALIAAAESHEVLTALGEAFGSPLTVKGVDMARYARGHYLRRHSDTFDDRHFAMIFFLADGWMPGSGGELVVESPDGAAQVAHPKQGHVALLRISPGHQHQVCRNQSSTWVRYGLSVHFGSVA